jgi:FixJ family two-component response regulator
MSGEELAAEVQTKYPQLRIVIASGYRATAGGTLTGDIQFIGKPYSYDDLRQVVEGATSDAAA